MNYFLSLYAIIQENIFCIIHFHASPSDYLCFVVSNVLHGNVRFLQNIERALFL